MSDKADQHSEQINVEVQFWGPFRQFSSQASVTFNLSAGATVSNLMEILYEKYGVEFKNHIIEENTGQFWSLMAIALNGRIMSDVKALNVHLCEGDKLLLLPPALGG
jgi:molybdopterin converting factor small subunit